jgi:hypothetical protein
LQRTHADDEIERPLQAEPATLGAILGIAVVHARARRCGEQLERFGELKFETFDKKLGRCNRVVVRSGVSCRSGRRAKNGWSFGVGTRGDRIVGSRRRMLFWRARMREVLSTETAREKTAAQVRASRLVGCSNTRSNLKP